VPADPAATAETHDPPKAAATPPPRPAPGPDPALAAQLLGQTGARRGLRGGPPVLDAARSTYLNAQYAGPADRRPPAGTRGKTEV